MLNKNIKKVITCCLAVSMLGTTSVFAEGNYADKKAEDGESVVVTDSEKTGSEYGETIFEKTDSIEDIDEEDVSQTNINVYVRGYDDNNGNYVNSYQKVDFPDATPIIVNDRTLIPIRGVAEKLGYEVNWSNIDRRVDIIKKSKDFDSELPTQCDRVFQTLIDNSTDGNNKNEYMNTTYYYYGLKNMSKDDLDRFKQRIIDNQEVNYGAYLRIGDSKGVAYVANKNRYGIDEARVNYSMDVPPALYRDRTMIPLRAVGEMLGFEVVWDGNSNTVYLDGHNR